MFLVIRWAISIVINNIGASHYHLCYILSAQAYSHLQLFITTTLLIVLNILLSQQMIVFEQRAHKLLEQLEVGRSDEERVSIVKKSSMYDVFNDVSNYKVLPTIIQYLEKP